MRYLPASVAALALVASAGLVAQNMTEVPGKNDPTRVTGGTYAVEPGHTQVAFGYMHMGITSNFGLIAMPSSGSLVLDPKQPEKATVSIEFPVANIRSGIAKLDEHLMKPEFFDAAKYPTAKFVSTSIKIGRDPGEAEITGNLTIKGITKPITMGVAFVGAGPNPMNKKENIGFSGTAAIKRSDFNMGYGVPVVGDEVELKIAAAFEK